LLNFSPIFIPLETRLPSHQSERGEQIIISKEDHCFYHFDVRLLRLWRAGRKRFALVAIRNLVQLIFLNEAFSILWLPCFHSEAVSNGIHKSILTEKEKTRIGHKKRKPRAIVAFLVC